MYSLKKNKDVSSQKQLDFMETNMELVAEGNEAISLGRTVLKAEPLPVYGYA